MGARDVLDEEVDLAYGERVEGSEPHGHPVPLVPLQSIDRLIGILEEAVVDERVGLRGKRKCEGLSCLEKAGEERESDQEERKIDPVH